MRAFAAAALAVFGVVTLAGEASARPWNDPGGRVTFDLPAGWNAEARDCPDCTYVLVFNASRDCHVYARPRNADQLLSAARVRGILRDDTRITQQVWTSGANAMTPVFPNDSAVYVSQRVEEPGFWPIQRAEFTNADGQPVHAAMQMRQNMEVWAMCLTVSGNDNPASFDAFFRSIATPGDAALQAEVEAAEAAAAAAPVAPPPSPPPANNSNNRNRN